MRLLDIVGVELSGKPGPGIAATDVVLSLTESCARKKSSAHTWNFTAKARRT
jgi:aconitase A